MIEVTSASTPRWADAARTAITLEVQFSHLSTPVPFTATERDTTPYSRDLFTRAAAGEFGTIAAYSPPTPPVPEYVSNMQFWTGAARMGFITYAEALTAAQRNGLPPAIASQLLGLTAEQQAEAAIRVYTATNYYRNDPLINAAATALGLTSTQVDDFFRMCATIGT